MYSEVGGDDFAVVRVVHTAGRLGENTNVACNCLDIHRVFGDGM